jgi:uncharacterized protein
MLNDLIGNFGFTNPAAFGLLVTAATLGGLVRGFSGFGFAMVFMPLASIAVGPLAAVGLIYMIDLPFALPLAIGSLRKTEWREVLPLIMASALCFPIGVWLLLITEPVSMRWIIVTLVICAAMLLASGWRYRGPGNTRLSAAVGSVAGLLSGMAQLGGMPIAVFWLSAVRTNAAQMRHNLNTYFAAGAVITGGILLWRGVLTPAIFWQAVPLLVPYGLAIWLGARSFHLASEATFRRIAYTIIFATAILSMPLLDTVLSR